MIASFNPAERAQPVAEAPYRNDGRSAWFPMKSRAYPFP